MILERLIKLNGVLGREYVVSGAFKHLGGAAEGYSAAVLGGNQQTFSPVPIAVYDFDGSWNSLERGREKCGKVDKGYLSWTLEHLK